MTNSPSASRPYRVFTEGDVDRVVLERMLGRQPDVLPKPGDRKGKDAALAAAVAFFRQPGTRGVIALDLDDRTPDALVEETVSFIRGKLGSEEDQFRPDPNSSRVFEFERSRLAIWPIGLHDDPDLIALGINLHSVEDLLIKALHDPQCLGNLIRSEDKVRMPPGKAPIHSWQTTYALLQAGRANGFELSSSKQVLRIFQALIGFGASVAKLAEIVIKHAAGTGGDAALALPSDFVLP